MSFQKLMSTSAPVFSVASSLYFSVTPTAILAGYTYSIPNHLVYIYLIGRPSKAPLVLLERRLRAHEFHSLLDWCAFYNYGHLRYPYSTKTELFLQAQPQAIKEQLILAKRLL